MDTTYALDRSKYRPAPSRQTYRQNTDWSQMSNDELIFALNILSLHYSPYEVECMTEIQKRIERGAWIQIDSPVPTIAPYMPAIFYIFPFSLLWSQRKR